MRPQPHAAIIVVIEMTHNNLKFDYEVSKLTNDFVLFCLCLIIYAF